MGRYVYFILTTLAPQAGLLSLWVALKLDGVGWSLQLILWELAWSGGSGPTIASDSMRPLSKGALSQGFSSLPWGKGVTEMFQTRGLSQESRLPPPTHLARAAAGAWQWLGLVGETQGALHHQNLEGLFHGEESPSAPTPHQAIMSEGPRLQPGPSRHGCPLLLAQPFSKACPLVLGGLICKSARYSLLTAHDKCQGSDR